MSVSLQKGQKVSLTKSDGGQLRNVRMGLGWDAIKKKGLFGGTKEVSVDLDASAFLFDANKQMLDTVYFGQLNSKDGSLRHTGDNLTGAGDGDDESIMAALDKVSANVTDVVLVVNSYSGHKFNMIENAYCRVVDSDSRDTELCRYTLTGGEAVEAMVMAKLTRSGGGWTFTAVGNSVANGRRLKDVLPHAQTVL